MFAYKMVVWVKKGLKHAYVIYEWSILVYLGVAMTKKCNSCPKWWEMSLLKLLPLYWNKYNSNSMTYAWAVMYSSTKLISTCYLPMYQFWHNSLASNYRFCCPSDTKNQKRYVTWPGLVKLPLGEKRW